LAVTLICSRCGEPLPTPIVPPCSSCGQAAESAVLSAEGLEQLRAVSERADQTAASLAAPMLKLFQVVLASLLLNLLLAGTVLVLLLR
jgi:hypothetical protein